MGIGRINTEGELLNFIKQNVEVPDNLQGLLAGGFLKLVTAADVKVTFGAESLSTPATVTAEQAVNHGLGGAPTCVIVSTFGSNAFIYSAYAHTATATQVTLGIRHIDNTADSLTTNVHWVAIR